jgi:hypothetical protein
MADMSEPHRIKHRTKKAVSHFRNLLGGSKPKFKNNETDESSTLLSTRKYDLENRRSLSISLDSDTLSLKQITNPQSSCALLTTLPFELRRLIYTEVFLPPRNPMIHISYLRSRPEDRFKHWACKRQIGHWPCHPADSCWMDDVLLLTESTTRSAKGMLGLPMACRQLWVS